MRDGFFRIWFEKGGRGWDFEHMRRWLGGRVRARVRGWCKERRYQMI